MGSQTRSALGVLRWTWKICLPKGLKELPRAPSFVLQRPLSSSQLDSPLSTPAHTLQSDSTQLTVQALAEMGFSESQAKVVHEAAKKRRCRHGVPALAVLFSLGLNPDTVVKIMEKCSELYSLKDTQLQQRVLNLRKLGLLEGSLQRVISHYPQILSCPVKRMSAVSRLLREKCQFTTQQMADILRDSPQIVEQEPARLEYMFQYVYFRMGCRQAEMVKAKLFRLSLEELRCRHGFLERRGLYQTPDKKGQTLILNPRLKDCLNVSEEVFLSSIANATKEEFDVFRKLVVREQEEEDQGEEYSSDDDDDDNDDVDNDDVVDVADRHISFSSHSGKKTNQRPKNLM